MNICWADTIIFVLEAGNRGIQTCFSSLQYDSEISIVTMTLQVITPLNKVGQVRIAEY